MDRVIEMNQRKDKVNVDTKKWEKLLSEAVTKKPFKQHTEELKIKLPKEQ